MMMMTYYRAVQGTPCNSAQAAEEARDRLAANVIIVIVVVIVVVVIIVIIVIIVFVIIVVVITVAIGVIILGAETLLLVYQTSSKCPVFQEQKKHFQKCGF